MTPIDSRSISGTTVNAVPGAIKPNAEYASSIQQAWRQENLAVSFAVRQLNSAEVAGAGREVTFSLDPVSRRPIVKVIDIESRDVIAQWPQEYVLQMAEHLKKREIQG